MRYSSTLDTWKYSEIQDTEDTAAYEIQEIQQYIGYKCKIQEIQQILDTEGTVTYKIQEIQLHLEYRRYS